MSYQVFYTESVQSHIAEQVAYFKRRRVSGEIIAIWLTKLFDQIDSLYDMPKRCAVAEVESKAMGFEIRKLVFGDYLVHYRVDDSRRFVEILSFGHGARSRYQEPGIPE